MGLRATILGCGSSGGVPRLGGDWGDCDPTEPRNRRRRCSLLLEQTGAEGTTRVLIDTAPDMRDQLLEAGVGALLPLTSKDDLELMQALEMHLRQEAPPLSGRDHLLFRSAYFPAKGVVDGDFCQLFTGLSPDQQSAIAQELDRSPAEIAKKLEELANRIT
jgi:hypothetical protein